MGRATQRESLTKLFVETFPIANTRFERREIKHDGPFAPICAIRRVVGDLAEQIIVGLAELDIDPTTVSARHYNTLLGFFVERLAHTLEHVVGYSDGKRELKRGAV